MSDNSQGSSSMSSIALPQVDGLTFREAFIIIGIVMALIISLLILRFGCNVIVVDLCIMCDLQEAKRECIKFRDHYLPYFNTTTAAAAATTTTNTATRPSGRGRRSEQLQEVQRIPNQETEIELMNLDSLMSGLLLQERWQVMQMLLPEKIVSADDMNRWARKKNMSSSSSQQQQQQQQQQQPIASEEIPMSTTSNNEDTSTTATSTTVPPSADDHNPDHATNDHTINNNENSDAGVGGGIMTCSICLHDFEIGKSTVVELNHTCGHIYHQKCIFDWLWANKTDCPFCRTSMVSEQQVKETVRELCQQKKQGRKPSNKANTNNAVEEDNSSTDNINSNSGDDGSVSTDNDIV